MSPRIDPATPPFSVAIQAALDQVMPEGAPPLRLFTSLANDERLFSKFMAGGLLDKGNLTLRQREIVIDRVTARSGSEYEWGVHIAFFSQRVGLSEDQIMSLAHGDDKDACWEDEAERLLIRLCDSLHETCTVDDDLWTGLRDCYSENAIMEIIMLCGFYRTVAYLTNAIAIPLETFAARFPQSVKVS